MFRLAILAICFEVFRKVAVCESWSILLLIAPLSRRQIKTIDQVKRLLTIFIGFHENLQLL